MNTIKVIPLIPSLNPDDKLINHVKQLIKIGFKKIIIINDGSSEEYDKYFNELSKLKECDILKHSINQGKGRALKTGFNYYLNNYSNYIGVVTCDSDGQHTPKDTLKVANSLIKNSNCLILGTRNFNLDNIPTRSNFGNKMTSFIFKLLYGKKISDTQTGLRGLNNNFIKKFLSLDGERFEFEINMLIYAVRNNIKFIEEGITTIYIERNKSSHFNPLKDSLKIYKVIFNEFIKFAFSGISSFLIDILLFRLFINTIFLPLDNNSSIILSTILARIISSFINYNLNKNVVFSIKNKNNYILKYYSLCLFQMLTSAILVVSFYSLGIFSKTICKIIIDAILFFISYKIQTKYIFKNNNQNLSR